MLTRVALGLLVCLVGSWSLTFKRWSPRSPFAVDSNVHGSQHAHLRTARFSRRVNKTVVAVIDCAQQPCKNNAICHHGSHCECSPGFTGLLCEKPVSPIVEKCGFERGMCLKNDEYNEVNFEVVMYSDGISGASEGYYYAVTSSATSCPKHAILHSDVVHADDTLIVSFDYTTYGTGVFSFFVIDEDFGASYLLLTDQDSDGWWKSFNVTIPAGSNIVYVFSGIMGGPSTGGHLSYDSTYGAAAVDNVRITVQQ